MVLILLLRKGLVGMSKIIKPKEGFVIIMSSGALLKTSKHMFKRYKCKKITLYIFTCV